MAVIIKPLVTEKMTNITEKQNKFNRHRAAHGLR